MSLCDAVDEFRKCRNNIGIYREVIIEKLYVAFAEENEKRPFCLKVPKWAKQESVRSDKFSSKK